MASPTTVYNSFKQKLGNKEIDMDTDTFKIALLSSTYTPSQTTHDEYADLTNELSTANGYTSGGQALTSLSWSESAGTSTWDAADPVWTASGGSIVARYAVIYDDTATGKPLVCYILLDDSPADVTTTDGNTLTIIFNASGIFTIANS